MSRTTAVNFRYVAITTLICIVGGALVPLVSCGPCLTSLTIYLRVAFLSVSLWLLMWFGNEFLNHYLDRKISWTTRPVLRLVTGIGAMVIYTVLTTLALVKIVEWIFDSTFGNVSSMVYMTVLVTFIITLFMTSRSFLFNWKQVAINAEKLQRENLLAKYENLKNQVNPHFLFNSLNALTNLVHENPDRAVKFIKQLSDVYRYVLDTKDQEVVPLDEELKFLNAYIFLQQIRFGENLKIDVQLNGGESMVAPLSLQMLIENAIKHNVVSKDNPLDVKVYTNGQYIIVENNLQKKARATNDSSGLGLENIRKRYEYISDKKIIVDERDSKFVVHLPLITEIR
jgi:LytS/YehU family sensor histidine kinase